jgi:hypothetical protein
VINNRCSVNQNKFRALLIMCSPMTEDDTAAVRLREALFAESATEWRSLLEIVLPELVGRLWHTTHPDRLKNILAADAILPEPDIPDHERYGTGLGKDHYPYVRVLGGVSLFDFNQFDPDEYGKRFPVSTWSAFVPYRRDWGRSVWIEIDRGKAARNFVSGLELLAKWKSDNAYGHNIMPEIEAAHLGPLSRTAFKRAFLVGKHDTQLHPLTI